MCYNNSKNTSFTKQTTEELLTATLAKILTQILTISEHDELTVQKWCSWAWVTFWSISSLTFAKGFTPKYEYQQRHVRKRSDISFLPSSLLGKKQSCPSVKCKNKHLPQNIYIFLSLVTDVKWKSKCCFFFCFLFLHFCDSVTSQKLWNRFVN